MPQLLQRLRHPHAGGQQATGSLENAIVLDDTKILNPEGLRFDNEFVRHKILDALGDLVNLGMPLMGHLVLYKAGHDVLHRLVQKILESPEHCRQIELGSDLPETTAGLSNLWSSTRH